MFYQKRPDKAFRFGDVLRGFFLSSSFIDEPLIGYGIESADCKIDLSFPKFCVLLTPCCSIGNNTIALTPLINVNKKYFTNPFFSEDLTRINRKMEPKQAVSPDVWKELDYNEQIKRLGVGENYALVEVFIYEQNPVLPKYKLGNIDSGYYMIDFRNNYKIKCKKIPNPIQVPLEAKCLQLSVAVREELRNKLASYYARVPAEDII